MNLQVKSSRYFLPVLLAPVLVLILTGTTFCAPADPGPEAPAGTALTQKTAPSVGTYLEDSVSDVIGGTERIFSTDNTPLALTGVGLAGMALFVDHRVDDYFADRNPMAHLAKYGARIGNGKPEVGVAVALLGVGELADDRTLADTGVTALEAYIVDGIATESLKYIVRRKRPNGGDRMSFPSGHASITATMAASISEMYDWDLRIAVPLYVTTAFVSTSRLQAHEHYLSDVIAGMTVGTVVGSSFAKYRKEKNAQSSIQPVAIVPIYDKDLRGYVVTMIF